jgi:hypothetical protein
VVAPNRVLQQTGLELRECRVFKIGCVYVTYRVKH